MFPIFSWFNATVVAYRKHLLSFLLVGFIVAFLLFIKLKYDPIQFGFILWHLYHNKWRNQKQNHYLSFDVSNTIWYLEKSDWESFSVTSSALPLILISMLSLFECTTLFSSLSLEEIKLFALVK